MTVRAFICGCKSTHLNDRELRFFQTMQPWGLILFGRNIETPEQVKALVADFRKCVGRPDAPVLIDQEGGRVQRLKAPHWRSYVSAAKLGAAASRVSDPKALIETQFRLMAQDLIELGINVDCLPVLDLPCEGADPVIGDRAFGLDCQTISAFGRFSAEALLASGILPVMKHIPGHGRAYVDTHFELPIVTTDLETLQATDFVPFAANSDLPAAMSAHVVFTAIDPENPATLSKKVIDQVIRHTIGFEGLLMSDDLSMQALSGSLGSRAERGFAAGLDIALHCNGDLAEALDVASVSPVLEGRAKIRADRALSFCKAAKPFDILAARTRLDLQLGGK